MRPEFPRITEAIHCTLEYYGTGRIADYMHKLEGRPNFSYLDNWDELIIHIHKKMEDEILQTIQTSNQATQNYLFDQLKDWQTDWRIESVNERLILQKIDQYNEKLHSDLLAMVNKAVEEFRSKPDFKRENLEEYEVEQVSIYAVLSGHYGPPIKRKVINYKYYCIEEEPEYIDASFVGQYFTIVNRIITNFRNIIGKYVKQYDEGKIISTVGIMPGQRQLSNKKELKLLDGALPEAVTKLKVDLSVPELACLFWLLNDLKPGIFKVESKAVLYRFIAAHFTTRAADDISPDSIRNNFNPEKKTANFWVKHLQKMLEQARKV